MHFLREEFFFGKLKFRGGLSLVTTALIQCRKHTRFHRPREHGILYVNNIRPFELEAAKQIGTEIMTLSLSALCWGNSSSPAVRITGFPCEFNGHLTDDVTWPKRRHFEVAVGDQQRAVIRDIYPPSAPRTNLPPSRTNLTNLGRLWSLTVHAQTNVNFVQKAKTV